MKKMINIDKELEKLIKFLEWKKSLEYEYLFFYPDEIKIEDSLIVLRHIRNNTSNTEFIDKNGTLIYERTDQK
jgi:hypothetical protein